MGAKFWFKGDPQIIVTLIIVTLAQWARTAQSKNDQKWHFLAFFGPFLVVFGHFDPKITQNPQTPLTFE